MRGGPLRGRSVVADRAALHAVGVEGFVRRGMSLVYSSWDRSRRGRKTAREFLGASPRTVPATTATGSDYARACHGGRAKGPRSAFARQAGSAIRAGRRHARCARAARIPDAVACGRYKPGVSVAEAMKRGGRSTPKEVLDREPVRHEGLRRCAALSRNVSTPINRRKFSKVYDMQKALAQARWIRMHDPSATAASGGSARVDCPARIADVAHL